MGCASIGCEHSRGAAAPGGVRQGRGLGAWAGCPSLQEAGLKGQRLGSGLKDPRENLQLAPWPSLGFWRISSFSQAVGPKGSQSHKMQVVGTEGQRLRRWGVGTTDPGFKVG